MNSASITCTSRDCPERTGGNCIIASDVSDRPTADEVLFLSESNNIEDVWDTDSLLQAIEAWEYLKSATRLTPAVIRGMHSILMRNQDLAPNDRGAFRTCPVWVGGREGKPWYVVPELIDTWCHRSTTAATAERIQREHVAYEVIHPFADGNGRTGRMLLNWQRLRAGLPILVIKRRGKTSIMRGLENIKHRKGVNEHYGKDNDWI